MTTWTAFCPTQALADDVDLRLVPPMPAWPAGLPRYKRLVDGILLPWPLADAVHERLATCDRYPELAQVAMDQRSQHESVVAKTEAEAQRAADKAESDQRIADADAKRLTMWKGAGIAGATAIVIIVLEAVFGK